MFARSIPGNGHQSEHCSYSQLTNLSFGLSSSPIADAPAGVQWLRNLVPATSGISKPFLPGRNLGEVVDGYIDRVARMGLGGVAPDFAALTIKINRRGDRRPFVEMVGYFASEFKGFCVYEPQQHEMAAASKSVPAAAPLTSFVIPSALLDGMAELWADTINQSTRSLLIPPASGASEAETAAPPARGAAALSHNPSEPPERGSLQSDSIDVRERTQSRFESRRGAPGKSRSQFHVEGDHHTAC